MFEYEIMNVTTGERDFIWGHSFKDALDRYSSINPNEWKLLHSEYVD